MSLFFQTFFTEGGTSPHFMSPLQDLNVTEGDQLQLQCKLTGDPTPSVHWYKDGSCIDDNPDYDITRDRQGVCTLTIEEVFKDDAGRFTCKSQNQFGGDETSSKITVTGQLLNFFLLIPIQV